MAELGALDGPVVVAGNGARRYRDLLGAVPGVVVAGPSLDFPALDVLGALVAAAASAGRTADDGAVLPHYLRDAETRINWETRAARPAPSAAAER